MIFSILDVINFAHGEFYMLGGYAFWYAYRELGLPYPVAGLAATGILSAFGWAYEHTVIRTILARTWHVQLIATLATSITLTNLAILVFGTQPKEVPTVLSSTGISLDSALQGSKLFSFGGFFGAVGGAVLIGVIGSRVVGATL